MLAPSLYTDNYATVFNYLTMYEFNLQAYNCTYYYIMAVASSAPFDLGHIFDALKELTLEQTKTLFFNITGGPLPELLIEHKHFGKGLVIAYWLDNDADASWEKICSGLQQIKLNVLAEKINSQYCTPPQVLPSSTDDLSTDSTVCKSHQSAETIQVQSGQSPTTTGRVPEKVVNSQLFLPCGSQKLAVPVEEPTDPTTLRVMEVKEAIEMFEDNFSDIISDMRQSLREKERRDPEFLEQFRDYLLSMPLSKKARHAKFFADSEDEILEARNIRKILVILGRYCNHSNYDIMLRIINKFCDVALKERMSEYCRAFEQFERSTTIDIYCRAISASPGLLHTFGKVTVKMGKPPTACTLYEVRQFKEALTKESFLPSYCVYIDSIAES